MGWCKNFSEKFFLQKLDIKVNRKMKEKTRSYSPQKVGHKNLHIKIKINMLCIERLELAESQVKRL